MIMVIETDIELERTEFEELGKRIVSKVVGDLVSNVVRNIDKFGVVASGLMKRSVKEENESVIVDVPYASYLEFGTRPHKVPVRALYKWAKIKFKMTDKEAWAVAYSVAKKIEREGTKPKPFVRSAVYSVVNEWNTDKEVVV